MDKITMTQALSTMPIKGIIDNTNIFEKLIELCSYGDGLIDEYGVHNYTVAKKFLKLHDVSSAPVNDLDTHNLVLYNDLTIEQLSCLETYLTDCGMTKDCHSIKMEYFNDIIDLIPGNLELSLNSKI